LQENLHRCHCRPIPSHPLTIQNFAKDHGAGFAGVLLDAPCSGLGVIGRQPDIRWNRTPADLEKLAQNQRDILDATANMVCPGGVIVYVTCSLATIENEDVIAAFLTSHPDYSIFPPHLDGPAQTLISEQGFLRTLPSQGLDGFFAARLVKNHI
jgi:16S rRNA (cytosine967-C5)-methyltransferase